MASSRPAVRRVLIVEDEPFIAFPLADQLVELGYTIIGPAFSLDEAKRFAATSHIDLALLDPELQGRLADDVANILVRRKIPILLVTGYDEAPAAAFRDIPLLTKPFAPRALQSAIAALLAHE